MQIATSKIPFNYKTIKLTQSRLNKGLLAIPASLIDYFPKQQGKIRIVAGINDKASLKTFTPYTSSSRECRIGGMREFYEKFNLKDGDEIVVQILDADKYRVLAEGQFEGLIRDKKNWIRRKAKKMQAQGWLQSPRLQILPQKKHCGANIRGLSNWKLKREYKKQ